MKIITFQFDEKNLTPEKAPQAALLTKDEAHESSGIRVDLAIPSLTLDYRQILFVAHNETIRAFFDENLSYCFLFSSDEEEKAKRITRLVNDMTIFGVYSGCNAVALLRVGERYELRFNNNTVAKKMWEFVQSSSIWLEGDGWLKGSSHRDMYDPHMYISFDASKAQEKDLLTAVDQFFGGVDKLILTDADRDNDIWEDYSEEEEDYSEEEEDYSEEEEDYSEEEEDYSEEEEDYSEEEEDYSEESPVKGWRLLIDTITTWIRQNFLRI